LKLTLTGLDRVLPKARCHRVVRAGRVTLCVVSDDPSRTLDFELTREDLDEIDAELRMIGTTIVPGDVGVLTTPAAEIDDVPGAIAPDPCEYRAG
jgi:hypothetical protein